MDAFDRFSPALRYQIVNELRWTGLRPVQEASAHAILDGDNCVVLAPTAGGKTESALFPLLSAMDTEGWSGTSVLYVAPIRALLNNQDERIGRYARMIGRRAFTWHGDIKPAARKGFVRDPADLLLTTPESVEVMLISPSIPAKRLFAGLRAVVIDEVHAFVGDDRGGHMSALLERLSRFCGRDLQRIGLSATVGNPETIVQWLGGSSKRNGRVVRASSAGPAVEPEVTLDYVGGLENAARVVAALNRGRKRLVFSQSRRQAEELTRSLRTLGVETFVSHSSLSVDERAAAERAFAEGTDCVIVATSALELGIDVGDLDNVLQIDSPSSVASFLQRMGRSGRRAGTRPNCTILATDEDELWQSAALLRLWRRGYVEPLRPPSAASHLLAHQLLALALQEGGVATSDWWSWLSSAAPFRSLTEQDRDELVSHMVEQGILALDGGRYALGPKGEELYGFRYFSELYSVFDSSRSLKVFAAGEELGTIDSKWVESAGERPLFFTLAGRTWRLSSVEWERGRANVIPSTRVGSAMWLGSTTALGRALCAEQRRLIADRVEDPWWSRRARERLAETRRAYDVLTSEGPLWIENDEGVRLWTFAGFEGNGVLAGLYESEFGVRVTYDNLRVRFSRGTYASVDSLDEWLRGLRASGRPNREDALAASARFSQWRLSKFQPCLPARLVRSLIADTYLDEAAARDAISQ
ncbi:MAG: DEAD/DEAH box helicase [Myxococcales bacterium]|nr:DEAD/DEAH box helicase [Myxococcales bacterium]